MRILGIETSCDESAAAVVEDGHRILANMVATQIDVHRRYGGVVPEVASRQQLQTIIPVIEQAPHTPGRRGDERDWSGATALPGTWNFSFSGLKTAVLTLTREPDHPPVPEIAAAFQESVVDVLTAKTVRAAREYEVKQVLVAGGVAANGALRATLRERAPVPVRVPPPRYCTDNAVMVGACGYFHALRGDLAGLDLDVQPNFAFAS